MRVRTLVAAYMHDKQGNFRTLRYATRQGYIRLCERIVERLGHKRLSRLTSRHIMRAHARWAKGGTDAMAHSLVTMLRTVIGFGAAVLENKHCRRLRKSLSALRFKMPRRRTRWISADQATAIRRRGRLRKLQAVALAQAIQFDCALRQKDVIGEWVPQHEDPTPSAIVKDGMKWVRGITMEEVDRDLVLTHKTSKRGKVLVFPLKKCPMVLEEWRSAPASGPIIVDPDTGLPYAAWKFRRLWRALAISAGVPKEAWNMDSRAGRITEVIAAGASLEDARKLAGHAQQATTALYSRGEEQAIVRAMSSVSRAA